MSKNLTAQQLADELNVTRQLIYYHAKKLPKDSKTYDEDNTLVFTPDQQDILKSYMTDTLKEKNAQKNEKLPTEKTTVNQEKSSVKIEENRKSKVDSNDKTGAESASNDLSNAESNDKSNNLTNDKPEDVKDFVEDDDKPVEENVKPDKNTKELDNDQGTASYEKTVTVKDFIQQAVKDHLEVQKKVESEERQTLIGELEEKNAQISTLHKLLDQQQQLALVAEQKHQKLLDTLGIEDEKQLKAIVELTTETDSSTSSSTSHSSESSDMKDIYAGKNWFQRLFKL